ETSSAANVRRIEALTGPAAVELLRERARLLGEVSADLRLRPEDVPAAVNSLSEERRRLERALKDGGGGASAAGQVDVEALAAQADEISGARVLARAVEVPDAKALLDIADRVKGRLGDAAILLGTAT